MSSRQARPTAFLSGSTQQNSSTAVRFVPAFSSRRVEKARNNAHYVEADAFRQQDGRMYWNAGPSKEPEVRATASRIGSERQSRSAVCHGVAKTRC
jgi:hypothetical protein